MIEYDYKIVRTNGKELEIFKPDKIPKTLPNCVNIHGPNSVGKSTLLNIISLGFAGVDNEKIHPVLRRKMDSIMNSSHQRLVFNIKIKDRDGTLEISSEKLDPEKSEFIIHEVRNGGEPKLLSPIEFRSKYNLIYDIPENPTDRLKEFTREIQDMQRTYGSRLQGLNEFIRKNISEINDKDPKRLIELERQFKRLKDDNIILLKEIEIYENNLKLLEFGTYKKYLEEYRILYNNTEIRLKGSNKKEKSEKAKIDKLDKEYRKYQRYTRSRIDELKILFDKGTYLLRKLVPKNEKYNLEIWERIDVEDINKNLLIDNDLITLNTKFRMILSDIYNNNKTIFQEIELYRELKDILEPYKSTNIILFGTELPVAKYIEMLGQWIDTNDNLVENNDDIKNCIDMLDQLKEGVNELERTYLPKVIEIKKYIEKNSDIKEISIQEDFDDVDQLRNLLDHYKVKYDFYYGEASRIRVEENCDIGSCKLAKYAKFSEDDLLREITNMNEDILNKKARNNYNDGIISRIESEIDRLKKKKTNKYEKDIDKLNKLLLTTESLEKKFRVDFQSYLEKLSKGTYSKEDIVDIGTKQTKYYDSLFSYLGKRVNLIRHIDKEYKVDYIDLINNSFTSKDGETINFLDMGTGQGQLAYLLGLLNTQDDRKIILLLDEVAMMDNTTFGFILEKIRELYDKNRLLAAIVMQAQKDGNDVKISEI